MKKLLFLIFLLVGTYSKAQKVKAEVIELDTLTTTERDAIAVPTGRVQIIWNETTGQFEYNAKNVGWLEFGGASSDLDLTGNVLSLTNPLTPGNDVDLSTVPIIASALQNVVDDTSPNLGGILDAQGNTIDNVGVLSVDTYITMSNELRMLPDNTIGSGVGRNSYSFKTNDVAYLKRVDNAIGLGLDFNALTIDKNLIFTDTDITWNGTSLLSGGGSSPPFPDNAPIIEDDADPTKTITIVASNITTGTNRNLIMPDADVDLGEMVVLGGSGASIPQSLDYARFTSANTVEGLSASELLNDIVVAGAVNTNSSQTITNKTINADNNTISNIGSAEITDSSINEIDLNVTNAPTDDYVLSYNLAGTNFTWVDPSTIGSYPSTAQQYYVIENTATDIVNDADYALAANYKSLFYRNIDTLSVGDGVTYATNGNKPVMVQPTSKDSTYIKKVDGVDFFVAGQVAAITGDGLIVKTRNTAVGYKEGADAWYWSGDLTVHTEDPIMATVPEFFYSPETIDADAVSDADPISGANAWTDASIYGRDLTIGGGTFELNIQAGVGRQVRWTAPGWFDIPDLAALDVVPGTDEFTMIFRVGETVNPDGSGYAIGKAPATTGNRTGVFFDGPGSFSDVLVGGTGTAATPDTFSANSLAIVVVGTTTFDMWVDGTQVITGGTVGTGDPTGQSWNIGGRTDGSYLAGIGYTTDLVAMTKKAISTTERQAIEAKYQINP